MDSLATTGVAAVRGSFASHGHGVTIYTIGATSFLREISNGRPYGEAHRIATNETRFHWFQEKDYDSAVIFEVSTQLVGDPLLKLPIPIGSGCANAPAFIAGKGPSSLDPQGMPWVRGARKDGLVMNGVLDFRPFTPNSTGGGDYFYGNTLAAGNLRVVAPDTVDEIAVGKGPHPAPGGADSLVKVFDYDGTLRSYFYAFSTQTEYGVNVAVGNVVNDAGPQDIVVGKGPGSSFGPAFRVFSYSTGAAAWTGTASMDAFSLGTFYGVNVATGDVTGSELDEIITGKGPGTNYTSSVRVWNGAGLSPTELTAFRTDAFGLQQTWGVNVGSGDFDNDGKSELVVGKGPGDTAGGTGMDHEIRVLRWNTSMPSQWQQRLALTDPMGLSFWILTQPGLRAGARGIGYEGDASGGDELLVSLGPVQYDTTEPFPLEKPPDFRGSRVTGWDVDTSSGTWTASKILDAVMYPEHEYPVVPAVKGVTLARFSSVGIDNPLGLNGGLEQQGEERPVWPDKHGKEIAREIATGLSGAADGLFRDPEAKAQILASLRSIEEQLRRNATGAALLAIAQLELELALKVRNARTKADVTELLEMLRKSVLQQVANRPPVPVVIPSSVYRTSPATTVRVPLTASMSTDPDSTPGTRDNIRRYRWYDDTSGEVVGWGETVNVDVTHDGGGSPSVFTFTLEVEDTYGARSYATTMVTLVPEEGR